jgi:hypothetical protein
MEVFMSKVRLIILSLMAVFAISAVASASASAEEHLWLVNGARATGQAVLGVGGLFTLTAGAKVVTCHKIHSLGTVTGMNDLATSIHFLECEAGASGACLPFTAEGGSVPGLILLLNIPTLLTLRLTSTKVLVVADEFKENATTKEFVTLKFSGTGCGTEFPETKVKGNVAAVVDNSTQSLLFTSPELKGNTLEAFGVAAKFVGTTNQTLTAGGTLTAD